MMESSIHASAGKEPIFTPADLKRLLFPLLLEQFLSLSMGMADTMMVSSIGEAAISGVSLVDSINILVQQILFAISTGGAVVASQYLGRGDQRSAKKGAAQLYAALLMITIAGAVLLMMTSAPLLSAAFGAIEPDVMHYAQIYFLISVVSYPFMGIYGAGAALFRAQGDSRTSMLASLVMNVINVFGNALLIFVFRMGVIGAAAATLAGRVFAALFVTWRLQRSNNIMRIERLKAMAPDAGYIRRIMAIGIPGGIEDGMFNFGKLILNGMISTLGTAAIAAHAVCHSIGSVTNVVGSAVCVALIPVVGRCLGAGRNDEARRCAFELMKMAYAGIIAANVLVFIFMPVIAGWFSLTGEAAALAVRIIRSFNVVSVFIWATSFVLPNALRAGGDAKYTMAVSIISMWLCRVVLAKYFMLDAGFGLMGVWMGMFVDWVCRSVLFVGRYRGGKWMMHKVI